MMKDSQEKLGGLPKAFSSEPPNPISAQCKSTAYNSANDITKNKLNIVQKSLLRLICSAAKSTPITALESQSDIEPLGARRDKTMLNFCREIPENNRRLLETLYRPASQNLNMHGTPLQKTAVIREKYGIAENNKQPFSKLQYIEEKAENPPHTTAPGIDLKKADIPTTHLKSNTLAMIAKRYPSE
ncbi:hypothetical protein CDAR_445111 [Caerostris darwini]|uniref:Uncharacterized protein n=1 Tax=Caerostris darwini TaxID=1538125 RepID=A0AAV4RH26_9ARAC|nr:hypothetical protein CDAR_445111 [Caerostris darwini]